MSVVKDLPNQVQKRLNCPLLIGQKKQFWHGCQGVSIESFWRQQNFLRFLLICKYLSTAPFVRTVSLSKRVCGFILCTFPVNERSVAWILSTGQNGKKESTNNGTSLYSAGTNERSKKRKYETNARIYGVYKHRAGLVALGRKISNLVTPGCSSSVNTH